MELALTGSETIWNNLQDLSVQIRDKLLKRAMGRATRPIEAAAKSACPADLGVLRDSIATRTTSKGGKGAYVRAFIGPKTKVRVPVRVVTRGPRKGQVRIAIPTRYAHLVEFGHDVVVGGKVVGHVGPVGFMRKAWDEAGGEVALYTFSDTMQAGIAAEVIKMAIQQSKP